MRSRDIAVFVLGLSLAGPCAASTMTGNINFTESTAEIDTVQNTPVTQNIFDYSVELRAQMQGGSTVYDQTFNVAFSDPQVQNAVAAAQAILQAGGAVAFLGPNLLTNSQILLNSQMNTLETGSQITGAVSGTEEYIGPASVLTGDLGVCQSYTLDASNYPVMSGCSKSGGTLDLLPG